MKKNILVTSFCISIEHQLRRTLVQLKHYSTNETTKTQSTQCFTKPLCIFVFLVSSWFSSSAQTWIWYPGDYEIWLANQMQNRRTDRATFFPVFWKVDSHYPLMDFHKVFDVKEAEEVEIFVEGQYNVKLDGKAFEGSPKQIVVPAGKHKDRKSVV